MDDSTLLSLAERLLPYGAVAVALLTPLFRKLVLRAIREEWPAVKEIIDAAYEKELTEHASAREQLARMVSHQERAQLDMQQLRAEVMRALTSLPTLTTEVTRISTVIDASTRAQERVAEAVQQSATQLAELTGEFKQFQREYDRRSTHPSPYPGPDRRGGS
jgi:methyl-accepting chemotaxis protein